MCKNISRDQQTTVINHNNWKVKVEAEGICITLIYNCWTQNLIKKIREKTEKQLFHTQYSIWAQTNLRKYHTVYSRDCSQKHKIPNQSKLIKNLARCFQKKINMQTQNHLWDKGKCTWTWVELSSVQFSSDLFPVHLFYNWKKFIENKWVNNAQKYR